MNQATWTYGVGRNEIPGPGEMKVKVKKWVNIRNIKRKERDKTKSSTLGYKKKGAIVNWKEN